MAMGHSRMTGNLDYFGNIINIGDIVRWGDSDDWDSEGKVIRMTPSGRWCLVEGIPKENWPNSPYWMKSKHLGKFT